MSQNDQESIDKAYKDGVKSAYNGDVLFLNPRDFNGDVEHDLGVFKKAIEDQYPEDADNVDVSDPSIRSILIELTQQARDGGPFAVRLSEDSCIVNMPDDDYSTKKGFVSEISGIPQEYLADVPGKIEDYVEYAGIHEGVHCGDPANVIGIDHDDAETLQGETKADFVADSVMIHKGKDDVVQTIAHSRAVGILYGSDSDHATTVVKARLDEDVEIDYKALIDLSDGLESELVKAMVKEIGVDDESDIAELYEESPELFYDVVETMVARGVFDDNNPLKEAVVDLMNGERALWNDLDAQGMGDGSDTSVENNADEYVSKGVGGSSPVVLPNSPAL